MAKVRISEILLDATGQVGKILLDNGDELIGVKAVSAKVEPAKPIEVTLTWMVSPASGGMHLLVRHPHTNGYDQRHTVVEEHDVRWENDEEVAFRKSSEQLSRTWEATCTRIRLEREQAEKDLELARNRSVGAGISGISGIQGAPGISVIPEVGGATWNHILNFPASNNVGIDGISNQAK